MIPSIPKANGLSFNMPGVSVTAAAGTFLDSLTIADFQFQISDVSTNPVLARRQDFSTSPNTTNGYAIVDANQGSSGDFAAIRVKCTALQAGQSLEITDLDYGTIVGVGASNPSNAQLKIPTNTPVTNNPGVFDVVDTGNVTVNDNSSFFDLGFLNCTRAEEGYGRYYILFQNITFNGLVSGSSVGSLTLAIPQFTVTVNESQVDYDVPAGSGMPFIYFSVNKLPEADD
jgi:hypothetical protein